MRRNAAAVDELRAVNAASGVVTSHAPGSTRSARAGAKPKNAAVTGAGPTGPSGAARKTT